MARPAALLLAVPLIALALATSPAGAAQAPGTFQRFSYTNSAGTRQFMVYVPPGTATAPRPLVVFLHGCTQTADDVAVGTRWNQLAAQRGFVVAYPEQDPAANGSRCWNWFLPGDQQRDAGEPSIIAGITRSVMASENIDPARVYVVGISAGADMTTILAATYPDLYAAASPIAGCAYLTCADGNGQAAYAAMGPRKRIVPILVEQGTADMVNNFPMGLTAVEQWLGTDDLVDDGTANQSVSRQPAATENHGVDASALAGVGQPGDPCVGASRFPCAGGVIGFQGSYPYTVQHYADAAGCAALDFWIVHGLNHAYPGGDPKGSFTDPLGPDLTTAVYDFFTANPMTRPTTCAVASASTAGGGGPTATVLAATNTRAYSPASPSASRLPATGRSGFGARVAALLLVAAWCAALGARRSSPALQEARP